MSFSAQAIGMLVMMAPPLLHDDPSLPEGPHLTNEVIRNLMNYIYPQYIYLFLFLLTFYVNYFHFCFLLKSDIGIHLIVDIKSPNYVNGTPYVSLYRITIEQSYSKESVFTIVGV